MIKRNKVGRITLLNIKAYCIATVIKNMVLVEEYTHMLMV